MYLGEVPGAITAMARSGIDKIQKAEGRGWYRFARFVPYPDKHRLMLRAADDFEAAAARCRAYVEQMKQVGQ